MTATWLFKSLTIITVCRRHIPLRSRCQETVELYRCQGDWCVPHTFTRSNLGATTEESRDQLSCMSQLRIAETKTVVFSRCHSGSRPKGVPVPSMWVGVVVHESAPQLCTLRSCYVRINYGQIAACECQNQKRMTIWNYFVDGGGLRWSHCLEFQEFAWSEYTTSLPRLLSFSTFRETWTRLSVTKLSSTSLSAQLSSKFGMTRVSTMRPSFSEVPQAPILPLGWEFRRNCGLIRCFACVSLEYTYQDMPSQC